MIYTNDKRPRIFLNSACTYWLGENADFTVLVPVEVMTKEVSTQVKHLMRFGHISYLHAAKQAVESTRLVSYWLDTKYAEPRYCVNPRKQVIIDAISGRLRDSCVVGENGHYYYVLALTPEYMIIRQSGHDEHLAVFNAEYSSERLNGIRDYLLNLPISVNLRITYKLSYMQLFSWFNERYVLIEA